MTAKDYPERITFALIEELQGQFIDAVGERSLSATQHALNKPCTRVFKTLAAKCAPAGRAAVGMGPRLQPAPPRGGLLTDGPLPRPGVAHVRRYEDTAKVDRLSRVQDQVHAVTETMQDNVQQMLANVDRADQLVDDTGARGRPVSPLAFADARQRAANLADAADKFKKDARGLSRTMWCRKLKVRATAQLRPRAVVPPHPTRLPPNPPPAQMNLLIVFIFLAIVGTIVLIVVLGNQ